LPEGVSRDHGRNGSKKEAQVRCTCSKSAAPTACAGSNPGQGTSQTYALPFAYLRRSTCRRLRGGTPSTVAPPSCRFGSRQGVTDQILATQAIQLNASLKLLRRTESRFHARPAGERDLDHAARTPGKHLAAEMPIRLVSQRRTPQRPTASQPDRRALEADRGCLSVPWGRCRRIVGLPRPDGDLQWLRCGLPDCVTGTASNNPNGPDSPPSLGRPRLR